MTAAAGPAAEPPPNVARIDVASLRRRALGQVDGTRRSAFQMVIAQDAYDAMHEHARSTTEVEVCGILAGELVRDARGPYLLVSAAVAGHAATTKGASVTITAETWQDVNATLEAEHPELKICGWFHTHPDFGVFLSEPDLFIHRSFFDLPWQVAVVVDPVRDEEGCFVWREGQVTREPMLIEKPRGGTRWKVQHNAERIAGRGKLARLLGGPTGIGPARLTAIALLCAALLAAAGWVGWAVSQGWDAQSWIDERMKIDAEAAAPAREIMP